jgi:hypothetical protein
VTHRRLSVVLALLLVVAAGCGLGAGGDDGQPASGDAFGPWLQKLDASVATLRPHQRFGLFFGDFKNKTSQPVTITGSPITGTGLGSVVRVVSVQAAPLNTAKTAMAGAIYVTDPPVSESALAPGGCAVADLHPVSGLVVKPGQEFRFFYVVETLAPGRWQLVPHIRYTRAGKTYEESSPYYHTGEVATGGRSVVITPEERRCLSKTKRL